MGKYFFTAPAAPPVASPNDRTLASTAAMTLVRSFQFVARINAIPAGRHRINPRIPSQVGTLTLSLSLSLEALPGPPPGGTRPPADGGALRTRGGGPLAVRPPGGPEGGGSLNAGVDTSSPPECQISGRPPRWHRPIGHPGVRVGPMAAGSAADASATRDRGNTEGQARRRAGPRRELLRLRGRHPAHRGPQDAEGREVGIPLGSTSGDLAVTRWNLHALADDGEDGAHGPPGPPKPEAFLRCIGPVAHWGFP